MKFKTIREGNQAVIYNHLGEGELVKGPRRVFLFRKRLHHLTPYVASQHEYLVIRDKDGVVKHQRGPCEVFFNPLLYESIKKFNIWKLNASQMVVVYKRLKSDVERRIIQGPNVIMPEAEEWLHHFCWHGSDPDNQGRMIPGFHSFTRLQNIPSHFYYSVRDVRTNDDTMITVKLMLFYSMEEVLKMLDVTKDPIADMINAVCADVIAFVGKLSYAEFLEQTHKLNAVKTYPQLLQRAKRIGFSIEKLVYRGYHSSDQLQQMQNSAIESRTKLRLNAEIEEQKQRLTDLKLNKEQARTKLKQKMDESRQKHRQQMEETKQSHQIEMQQLQHAQTLLMQTEDTQARLDHQAAEHAHRINYLTKLEGMNVNLTDYLNTQAVPKVSEEIRVVKNGYPSTDL